jgi:hypothetical protein
LTEKGVFNSIGLGPLDATVNGPSIMETLYEQLNLTNNTLSISMTDSVGNGFAYFGGDNQASY